MSEQGLARRETDILPKLTDDAIASVAANIRQFEKFKQSVLGEKDYTWMGDNQYIEKSGWVKMRMAMNCSFEILDEGQRIVGTDDEGEYYTWIFKGRATAPNGVSVQMSGACSSRDEFFSLKRNEEGESIRRKSSEIDEKDIIVTAQTNCFNRCMSFLCGFGELSGEEVRGKQFSKKPATFPFGDLKGQEPSALDLSTLHKALPFWERQAADSKNKFAEANKKLVAAIKDAIAEKSSRPESPAAPDLPPSAGERSGNGEPTPPAGDTLSATEQHAAAVQEWREELEKADSLEKLSAIWKTLQGKHVWPTFSGDEQTVLSRAKDTRKTALSEPQGTLG